MQNKIISIIDMELKKNFTSGSSIPPVPRGYKNARITDIYSSNLRNYSKLKVEKSQKIFL